jgi:hydrogenase expression/formation protein HypE
MGPAAVQQNDVVLVNGDLGRHGIAIMAVREGLEFETQIESDSAPLNSLVAALLDAGVEIHCMRDLTRGGLSSALNEIAESAGVSIVLDEDHIPVREDVRGACEMLGLDPLYVANEGRLAIFVAAQDAERALLIMRMHNGGFPAAARIGAVHQRNAAPVLMRTQLGPARILDMLSGEQLPRIC